MTNDPAFLPETLSTWEPPGDMTERTRIAELEARLARLGNQCLERERRIAETNLGYMKRRPRD